MVYYLRWLCKINEEEFFIMNNIAIVFHKRYPALVYQSVLDEMGLSAGQNITDAQFYRCIVLTATMFIAKMVMLRAAGKEAPDTSPLEAKISSLIAKRPF